MQPPTGDTLSQTSLRIDGDRTNHAQAGQPTIRQSLAAMANPSLAGRACARTTPTGHAVCDSSDSDNSATIAEQLAATADNDTDVSDTTADAADASSNGSLSHAAPLAANIPDVSDFHQVGSASWYGDGFHGRRTASGERYDMHDMTAAHLSLPLLSYIRVTNVFNHRSVIVKVNDRGPYHGHRILDLSLAAAKALGMMHRGTGRVAITGLSPSEVRTALAAPMLASR